uniref:Uncharacterized protein n=1 Tax=Tanacetum cinerariifolium TaxID=118510 RepID=A0A6L2L969_TANCI|nr:hypothetical protein [Tanacetum cinerariifolium]
MRAKGKIGKIFADVIGGSVREPQLRAKRRDVPWNKEKKYLRLLFLRYACLCSTLCCGCRQGDEPMVEEQDEQQQQQQQQNLLDANLVPINEQVKIATSNFWIALGKTQPDVIYKAYLEIRKKYSFYNAFFATVDALEIYMQQFWYTINYDLTAKAFFFTMGDKVYEVNEDLPYNALSITPKKTDYEEFEMLFWW